MLLQVKCIMFTGVFQNKIQQDTDGSFSKGHLVVADKADKNPNDPTQVRYEGSLTHGRGSPQNPSALLDSKEDVKGESQKQYLVPPRNSPTYIDENSISAASVPGSLAYLEKNKENLQKNQPLQENT